MIEIRLLRDGGNGGYVRGVALRRHLDLRMDDVQLKLFTFGGEQKGKVGNGFSPEYLGDASQEEYERNGADAGLELRVPVKAGPHPDWRLLSSRSDLQARGCVQACGIGRERRSPRREIAEPWVDSVTINGPFNVKGLGDGSRAIKRFLCVLASGWMEHLV